ncbi:hypothetical protein EVAR_37437_1 [Eumeta japonica]|uniref:Uncharacterized protein n=1 Tax=Eumeta variegata TaxID=151549 RepID=A0A4C1X6B2_EUMVA|nr:hypothetical protein EVAR_37437_1 [Eumeta japonica]
MFSPQIRQLGGGAWHGIYSIKAACAPPAGRHLPPRFLIVCMPRANQRRHFAYQCADRIDEKQAARVKILRRCVLSADGRTYRSGIHHTDAPSAAGARPDRWPRRLRRKPATKSTGGIFTNAEAGVSVTVIDKNRTLRTVDGGTKIIKQIILNTRYTPMRTRTHTTRALACACACARASTRHEHRHTHAHAHA